jgi:hypothetical protein
MDERMNIWIRIGLLTIALIAYAAGGAALAVLRVRRLNDGLGDNGMSAVATALLTVGALCSAAGGGILGIFAFGGVCVWASYIAAAQRVGLFRVQTQPRTEEATMEQPNRRA